MWFTRTQSYTSYVFIEKLKVKAGESGHNTSKAPWIEQDLYKLGIDNLCSWSEVGGNSAFIINLHRAALRRCTKVEGKNKSMHSVFHQHF